MLKHKNITEAYKTALTSKENKDFAQVIAFCENDKKCQDDNSVKKHMMLSWAYKKIASFYEKSKNYKKAYLFCQKAVGLSKSSAMKISMGHKMMFLLDTMNLPICQKASEIVKITSYMQKAYNEIGNIKSAERVARLQAIAEKLLKKSKYLH